MSNSEEHPIIKDSGDRRQFSTGAVRDLGQGKGRCDLIPLDVVSMLFSQEECVPEFMYLERFKARKDVSSLISAITVFCAEHYDSMASAMLDVSKHYEGGAEKYGENNWQKGIPLHCYIDSAARHLLKHLRGDTDERHDLAYIWNVLCAIWTVSHKPEMDDIKMYF